jgi:Na+-translocating ferredoxin:NAD+ oxidoreductase RnfG subunit
MKALAFLQIVCFTFVMGVNSSGQSSKPFLTQNIQKKAQNLLNEIWKGNDVQEKPFEIKNFPYAGILNGQVNEVFVNSEKKAWSFYNSAKGRYDKFYFVVIYSLDLSIMRISVLEYNEMYGGEITRPKWLKKFEGYHASQNLHLGIEIDAISGATLSATALIDVVNKCSEFLIQLKNKGVI